MHVCGQTLILVDNDLTVGEVNQKLVNATLKYLFYHMPDDRTFALSTYGHDLDMPEEYSDEAGDLVCAADKIVYEDKDSNLNDTLCEVISRWKESDFACRDIIVFTDGLERDAVKHEKEELYYLIENSEYPVYVVMLDQDNNASVQKSLSAIAVTSGGKLFNTEFEGSDANVDKQLTEKIFAAMDEYRIAHWQEYETADEEDKEPEAEETVVGEPTEEALAQTTPPQFDGTVVYEYDRTPGFFESPASLVLSAILLIFALVLGIFASFVIMKQKRRRKKKRPPILPDDDDEYFEDYDLKGIMTSDLSDSSGDTVWLPDKDEGWDGATRLLADVPSITLTDETDPCRVYRLVVSSPMTVGRKDCDVTLTGDDAVSKRHCQIFEKKGSIYVKDLDSSNGTKLNDEKIKEKELSDGDRLTIGTRSFTVKIA